MATLLIMKTTLVAEWRQRNVDVSGPASRGIGFVRTTKESKNGGYWLEVEWIGSGKDALLFFLFTLLTTVQRQNGQNGYNGELTAFTMLIFAILVNESSNLSI